MGETYSSYISWELPDYQSSWYQAWASVEITCGFLNYLSLLECNPHMLYHANLAQKTRIQLPGIWECSLSTQNSNIYSDHRPLTVRKCWPGIPSCVCVDIIFTVLHHWPLLCSLPLHHALHGSWALTLLPIHSTCSIIYVQPWAS